VSELRRIDPLSARSRGPDDEVTVCKICRRGIYRGQEWTWSTRPLGMIHTGCQP